jgi:Bacterial SH3 domain
MNRFVFLSFAFLAFAFYQLSGGADFQPPVAPNQPVAAVKPAPTVAPQPVKAASLIASPAISPVDKTLNPDPADVATLPDSAAEAEAAFNLEQVRTSLGQGLTLFPASDPIAQPLTLASLEQGVAGLRDAPAAEVDPETPQAEQPIAPPADIREVRATRVNMRDGPGTIYPVIMRLTLGKEVEVLGDSGTGWLRLRALPEQTTGWIAASLISKAGQ